MKKILLIIVGLVSLAGLGYANTIDLHEVPCNMAVQKDKIVIDLEPEHNLQCHCVILIEPGFPYNCACQEGV